MKPYYQDEYCTIYHGDYREVMPGLNRGSVHLVAADLPYGHTGADWDLKIDLKQLWELYRHVMADNGVQVFTASQPFTAELVCSNLKEFRCEWIWRKNRASNFLNAKKLPLKIHETVLVFSPKAPRYFAQKTSGHPPINRAYRKANSSTLYRNHLDSVNNGGDTTRWPLSVLDFRCIDNISKDRVHPTQKPVELFDYFIQTYSMPGETVLDNCAGSGTVGVAAKRQGRNCILIERDERFCEAAATRVAQELSFYKPRVIHAA